MAQLRNSDNDNPEEAPNLATRPHSPPSNRSTGDLTEPKPLPDTHHYTHSSPSLTTPPLEPPTSTMTGTTLNFPPPTATYVLPPLDDDPDPMTPIQWEQSPGVPTIPQHIPSSRPDPYYWQTPPTEYFGHHIPLPSPPISTTLLTQPGRLYTNPLTGAPAA